MRRGLLFLTSHLVVALVALVAIGGATRVMEAGLACPDWPLCYGSFLPGGRMNLQVFLEWFHRLDAFLVGIALLVLSGWSVLRRQVLPSWLPWASGAALLLVAVQGLLGALTVTQLLRFDVVTAHLGTALVLVAVLSGVHQGLTAQISSPGATSAAGGPASPHPSLLWVRAAALATAMAALAVFAQAISGALMATQWASGRCLSNGEACGLLATHRQLAVPVALVVVLACGFTLLTPATRQRSWPFALAGVLLVGLQVVLGVLTLRLSLAVPLVTVGHQITAALLVGLLTGLAVRSWNLAPARFSAVHSPRTSTLESCHG
ncbi:COX15/CtaA family protein [Synechococcus sp. ATX 2A4]|uniref:COX15/CtaA family protein n=1 Tax=Synechococcus sp. ATX 2A4 TaxID=2823727 RepID=UPI0020CF57C7|nr:COX15/CtaA family protein [Synechococcus sp. ATX 2A4]MCP9884482.1 COX15/CtaA family protein [Synechococcus sp. ATX 2A4]